MRRVTITAFLKRQAVAAVSFTGCKFLFPPETSEDMIEDGVLVLAHVQTGTRPERETGVWTV